MRSHLPKAPPREGESGRSQQPAEGEPWLGWGRGVGGMGVGFGVWEYVGCGVWGGGLVVNKEYCEKFLPHNLCSQVIKKIKVISLTWMDRFINVWVD